MNIKAKKYLIGILFMNATLVFAQNGVRVYDNNGIFSFCPPLKWEVMEWPGYKYKVVIGPIEGKFAANITFADETYNGSLQNYVNYNLSQMGIYVQNYKLLNHNTFNTNSGITGERIIYNGTQGDFFLRAICYIFPILDNKYLCITCLVLDNVSTKYISLFDESIKTFEYIKKK